MNNFSDHAQIVFTLTLAVAGAAIWAAIVQLARLADRKVPSLALKIARLAMRLTPGADRVLYNFESDAYEALRERHRYSALGTATWSLVVVARRSAFRNGRRATATLGPQGLAEDAWILFNDPIMTIAIQVSPLLTLGGFAAGYLAGFFGTRMSLSRKRVPG